MRNNEAYNIIQQNETDNQMINTNNLINQNEIKTNNQQNSDDLDDIDDNLGINKQDNNNAGSFFRPRIDSSNSVSFNYKFSIDQPNVTKQRLNEYLNYDLLNELDVSPSVSKRNSGVNNNVQNTNNTGENNPENLYGFSLYSQPNNQNYGYANNFQNLNANFNNFNNQNNINNNYPNIQNNNNYYQNFNNQRITLNSNSKAYIPLKYRKNDQNTQANNNNDIKINKNKLVNMNKNKQKNKKYFEVRDGDWVCSKCKNLNFSFRNKCNRCSLPKELSQNNQQINPNMPYPNQHY
jgi:hypothetical protein